MPDNAAVTIAVEPPLSADARAISLRYFDDLVSRYHQRPATDHEITDVDQSYPSELLQAPTGVLLLARRGHEVLGCAGMRFVTETARAVNSGASNAATPTAKAGEVTRVFVDSAARGLGVARQLMGALEAEARALGLAALRLDTRSDLVEARRLYEAVGFVEGAAHNDDPYAQHWFRKEL